MLYGYRQLCSLHKKQDIYIDIEKDVGKSFYTSNYKLDGPLPKGKIKKHLD